MVNLYLLQHIVAYGLISLGSFFCLTAVVGILRFPDVFTRFHAGTKCTTAGAVLLLTGVAVYCWTWPVTAKLVLIILFMLMTNPISTHSIARAAYRQGIAAPVVTVDQYKEDLEQTRELSHQAPKVQDRQGS